jgi:methylated-DNA-[protein]-cysteine S-methyltransferase
MPTAFIETDDGIFAAAFSEKGLARLNFPDGKRDRCVAGDGVWPELHRWSRTTEHALKSILAGEIPETLPPFDLSAGTEFQQNVWNALRRIPAGQTRSYAEVARAIGRPRAVRAVGQACGANPIPVLVPCHRVVAAGGKLGGFSGGLEWKQKLLARESGICAVKILVLNGS